MFRNAVAFPGALFPHNRVTFAFIVSIGMLLIAIAPSPAAATHSPIDIDGDGWADANDNCPRVYNGVADYATAIHSLTATRMV